MGLMTDHDTEWIAAKPGVHSYNVRRRARRADAVHPAVRWLKQLLLLIGIVCIGYYGYTLGYQSFYQAYENWAFDQQIGGRTVTLLDYLREKTPLAAVMGPAKTQTAAGTIRKTPNAAGGPLTPVPAGELLGRIEVPRLSLSAMVREGVDEKTLSQAVGHVPSTALAGQVGNFAIAAHRDTLFRALKDIQKDDQVVFQAPDGTYTYQVVSTQIVKPTNIEVLKGEGDNKLLTMITCYPFYYVGSAPERFIVQAKLVSAQAGKNDLTAQEIAPPASNEASGEAQKIAEKSTEARHARSSAFSRRRRLGTEDGASRTIVKKRRGFWHKILHPGSSSGTDALFK